jgi:hypothetical protein
MTSTAARPARVITSGWLGATYEINLNDKNAEKFA